MTLKCPMNQRETSMTVRKRGNRWPLVPLLYIFLIPLATCTVLEVSVEHTRTPTEDLASPPGVPSTVHATSRPTSLSTPTPMPWPTMPLTATTLAEGLAVRLGTPDPSPNCPDHYPWFFDQHSGECAAPLLNTWGVWQPFEHGLMVWFQEGGHTYVLVDDGSLFKPYQEVSDTTSVPFPDPDPNLVPPPGLYQPVRGFAKFWRGLVPGSEWVRGRLGWALAPEVGYSALWQCNTVSGDGARCYFTGPHNEIIVMTRDSAPFGNGVLYWNYWQGKDQSNRASVV